LFLEGKGVMRLSFEVRIEKLEVVKRESLWSMLNRWLAMLWRRIQQRRN